MTTLLPVSNNHELYSLRLGDEDERDSNTQITETTDPRTQQQTAASWLTAWLTHATQYTYRCIFKSDVKRGQNLEAEAEANFWRLRPRLMAEVKNNYEKVPPNAY